MTQNKIKDNNYEKIYNCPINLNHRILFLKSILKSAFHFYDQTIVGTVSTAGLNRRSVKSQKTAHCPR
ncbi:hypothetical protein KPH14_008484 [Odynerus spinipes]|uniref:Uncharacterized protein n=1 Tax=Odynerus spinipes TaxID=1348599 RepID=A0AAD9VKY6_9HYME|nr:hypothetical protein KPH14_008484 [Odynerus spinipes]